MFPSRLTGLSLCAISVFALSVQAQDAPAEGEPPLVEAPAESPAESANSLPAVATCGGAPAVWIANAADASDVSTAATPLDMGVGAFAENGALVAFRITGQSQGVRIEAAATENGDPKIVLLTSDGDAIEESDDTENSLNSRIETTLGTGDYCVRVTSFDDSGVAANVRVGTLDDPRLFEDGTPSGPAISGCDASTEAIAFTEGSLDAALAQGVVRQSVTGEQASYLRFTLAEPASLTLRASSDSLDPTVVLFDGRGDRIAENDDADGTNSRLDFPTRLGAGDYCLGVAALSAGADEIQVSAEKLDPQSFFAAAWRRGELAPPLNGDYPVQELDVGTSSQTPVLLGGSAVWFTFELAEPSVVTVEAYGSVSGVDPKLALYGANGSIITENDDAGGTQDAKLPLTRLQPGRYMVALTNVGALDQPGALVRAVMVVAERFVPAQ